MALGQPNAIAVIAARRARLDVLPGRAVYMQKIAVGADAVDAIDINASPTENVQARVAKAKAGPDRHPRGRARARPAYDLIGELREAGARVILIRDGDVAPAIAAARPETASTCSWGSAARRRA